MRLCGHGKKQSNAETTRSKVEPVERTYTRTGNGFDLGDSHRAVLLE